MYIIRQPKGIKAEYLMTDKLAYDASFTLPKPAAAKAAGYSAVIRYLSPDPAKNLTKRESQQILDTGLGIGLVWESTAMRAVMGYGAGLADGSQSARMMRDLQVPVGTPIFANVGDWSTTRGQLNGVIGYYQGFVEGLREYSQGCGGYGNSYIINRLVSSGHHGIWWQNPIDTMGVPGSVVNQHASIYQRQVPTVKIPAAKPGSWDEDAYGFGPVPDILWWRSQATKPQPKPQQLTITQVQVMVTYSDGSTKTFPIG